MSRDVSRDVVLIQLVADAYETLTYDDVAMYVALYQREHPTASVVDALKVFHEKWEAFLAIEEERENATEH
jgi:hypothetical protein